MRHRLFWVVSRLAILLYGKFPIFGPIRGAVAIIRRDGHFVAIDRSDGFGLCFPGGNARPWEPEEKAVRREVHEEAGLQLSSVVFKFRFQNSTYYPVITSVFEGMGEGKMSGSWEGRVKLATLAELEAGIIPSQRQIVEYLKMEAFPS